MKMFDNLNICYTKEVLYIHEIKNCIAKFYTYLMTNWALECDSYHRLSN